MRILMLLAKDMEARSRRAAEALTASGHAVHILCRPEQPFKQALPSTSYAIEHVTVPWWLPPGWHRKATVPFPGNPFYLVMIARAIQRFKPDAIHVHDLPLVLPAFMVSAGQLPVVFDMHENYPAMTETWTNRSLVHRWFIRAGGYRFWERMAIQVSKHIVVVCDEQMQRVYDLIGPEPQNHTSARKLAQKQITIVGNTPSEQMIHLLQNATPPAAGHAMAKCLSDIQPTARIIFYSGILAEVRGVQTVIAAMDTLRHQHPDAVFVIAGKGAYLPQLQQQVADRKLQEHVRWVGWQNHEVLCALTQRAEICVIPHQPCEHINSTYPNKIFEYMAAGKPVVVSEATPLMRIIHEPVAGTAGLCADTVQEWIEALGMLLANPQQARIMGQRGQKLVHERYNAAMDGARLCGVYAQLESSHAQS